MAGAMNGQGIVTWAGSSRSVVRFLRDDQSRNVSSMPIAFDLTCAIAKATDCVRICVHGSSDHKTGWRLGIFNDAGTYKLSIRRITAGTYEAFAGPRTATIAASTTIPGTLRVTLRNDVWTLTLVRTGVADLSLTYTNSVDPAYLGLSGWGLESDVDGAVAGPVQYTSYSIVPQQLLDVPYLIGAGILHAVYGDNAVSPVGDRRMAESGRVAHTVHEGKVYTLGGGKVWEYDLIARTTTQLIASAGSFPGGSATETDATLVHSHGARLWLISGRFARYSAVGAATNWDTGELIPGAAGELAFSEPIASVTTTQAGTLVFGLVTKVATVTGDGGLTSAFYVNERPVDAGPSGPNAALSLQSGAVVMHTAAGIIRVADLAGIDNVSSNRLRMFIQPTADKPDLISCVVARDPSSQITFFFREGESEHVLLDEVHGGVFLVDSFPATYTVTAAASIRSEMWIGCSDGQIRKFAQDATSDGNLAVFSVMPLSPIDDEGLLTDVRLTHYLPLLSLPTNGAVTFIVYGANDRESVYTVGERVKFAEDTWTRGQPPIFVNQTAPNIMVEMRADKGVRYALEYLDASMTLMPPMSLSFGTEAVQSGPDFPPAIGSVGGGNPNPGGGTVGPGPGPVVEGGVRDDGGITPPIPGGSTTTLGNIPGGTVTEPDGTTPPASSGSTEGGTIEPAPGGVISEPGETPATATGTLGPARFGTEEDIL